MKKIDAKFLWINIGVMMVVPVFAVIKGLIAGFPAIAAVGLFLFLSCVIGIPYYFVVMPAVGKGKRNKTMQAGSVANGFQNFNTFDSSNAIIRIDNYGRVAIVTNMNPGEFQLFHARELTDIRTTYTKGPLGGATAVYFEFRINGTRLRIPTFMTNRPLLMKSAEIMEGTSKADYYCELLYNMQRVS